MAFHGLASALLSWCRELLQARHPETSRTHWVLFQPNFLAAQEATEEARERIFYQDNLTQTPSFHLTSASNLFKFPIFEEEGYC